MMRSYYYFFFFLKFMLALGCTADNDFENIFNKPGPAGIADVFTANPIWPVGSTQTIDFFTTATEWNVTLVQQSITNLALVGEKPQIATDQRQAGHVTFNWTVSAEGSDLQGSPVFYLQVNYGNNSCIISHYFNMTGDATSSTTAASTPSSTPAVATATTPPSTVVTVTAVPTPKANSNSGRNVGLGVGLGLGIPALAAIVGFAIWRSRTARKSAFQQRDLSIAQPPMGYGGKAGYSHVAYTPHAYEVNGARREQHEASADGQIYEVPTTAMTVELPTDNYRPRGW